MTRSRPTGRWGRWQLVALAGVIALVLAACTSDDEGGDGGQASDGETTGSQAQGGGSSAGQFCEGMNIVFFPGGSRGRRLRDRRLQRRARRPRRLSGRT